MKQKTSTQHNGSTTLISNSFPFMEKWEELESVIEKALNQTHENAIETLLYVSKKLKRHRALHYSGFEGDKTELKNIYNEDLQRRIEFACEKIAANFSEGQQQDVYRQDISTEMVARNYAKRMIDLHNPKIFPPQKLSFQTIYNMLFDDFIKSISNQNGLQYYAQVVQ
ncbi:MAG: hypothetical protein JXR65_06690 [Bacteroidales bacterium]|nr:hypothetical protein [Bacteroidales bacterium]